MRQQRLTVFDLQTSTLICLEVEPLCRNNERSEYILGLCVSYWEKLRMYLSISMQTDCYRRRLPNC